MTSVLMNHRLASEVAQARELEAFRTMSVFFVHDLKNAAASLNLMLRNLPCISTTRPFERMHCAASGIRRRESMK